eukprot:3839269-Amphidinium_carterae.2
MLNVYIEVPCSDIHILNDKLSSLLLLGLVCYAELLQPRSPSHQVLEQCFPEDSKEVGCAKSQHEPHHGANIWSHYVCKAAIADRACQMLVHPAELYDHSSVEESNARIASSNPNGAESERPC